MHRCRAGCGIANVCLRPDAGFHLGMRSGVDRAGPDVVKVSLRVPERLPHRLRIGCLKHQDCSLAVAREKQSDEPHAAVSETPPVRALELCKSHRCERRIKAELADDVYHLHMRLGVSGYGAHNLFARGVVQIVHQMRP